MNAFHPTIHLLRAPAAWRLYSRSRPTLRHIFVLTAALLVSACGGGGGGGGAPDGGSGASSPPPTVPAPLASYTISGTVSGMLGAGLVLTNGWDDIAVNSNGNFGFPTVFYSGMSYAVSVKTQPSSPAQRCTVAYGNGMISSSNITNVGVVCRNTIGGTTSGVIGTLVLKNNGGDDISISGSGSFVFPTALDNGAAYNVAVHSASAGQVCAVSNGTGVANGNVTNVQVLCKNKIGGTVLGLSGTVVLQNNAGDDLTINANGTFTFATPLSTGAIYKVTVLSQPAAQTCRVTGNGIGYAGDNSTAVEVRCVDGQWTWISGSGTANQGGVYGTKGTPAAENVPGSRNGAVTWTDSSGNLWLFGGGGYAGATSGYLNDLWRFDVTSGQWTWMSGANVGYPAQVGVYGTKGMAAAGNVPGGRHGAVSWTDAYGDLWLFGGYGYDDTVYAGRLNDLWKYNIAANQWTWVGGSDATNAPGVYGTKGVAETANVPGARSGAVTWADSSGNVLWLFGGWLSSTGSAGFANDLWKYDVASNRWTWIAGSSTAHQPGVYGTKGVAAADNVPGGRELALGWRGIDGALWIFGGSGRGASATTGELNDLWKFDGSQWTWMGGSDLPGQAGTYGVFGVAAAANQPGARRSGVVWTDAAGDFWLFGGYGLGPQEYYQSGTFPGRLNDLWKFDGSQWTWINGSNAINETGSYGTLGIGGTGLPGGRQYASSWIDAQGNLWLFGGDEFGYLNDLWRYK